MRVGPVAEHDQAAHQVVLIGPGQVGRVDVGAHRRQLFGRLDLDAVVGRAGLPVAVDIEREVDAGVVQHPLGVVGAPQRGLAAEQPGIELDRLVEVVDLQTDVHAPHGPNVTAPHPSSERTLPDTSLTRGVPAAFRRCDGVPRLA